MANYEKQLTKMIENDSYIMSILKVTEKVNLADGWICAGIIRNKVWDSLHSTTTPINDIDVIYFDTSDTSWELEKQIESELELLLPNQPWAVKNQARMHMKSGFEPFISSYDGVAHFPETPTAIAVRRCNKEIEIMAPYGIQDLFEMRVRPTPFYQLTSKFYPIYVERVKGKEWNKVWWNVSIDL